MRHIYFVFFAIILFSCGQKQQKNPVLTSSSDTTTIQKAPVVSKDYLKKRPEEFQEFFMLSDVAPFTGKVASKKDVQNKVAVFNLESKKDPSHRSLKIRLPFFAFLQQPKQQPSKFVVIMQAEYLKGDTILGYKEANGLFGICKPTDLEYFESQKGNVYSTLN